MEVKVKLYGTLSKYVPGYNLQAGIGLRMAAGSKVEDVMRVLRLPHEEAQLVFVRGISRRTTEPLQDGDEVSFFLPIGGG